MNWFRNRNTATKLLLTFSIVVALVLAVAAVGNYGMSSILDSVTILYERHALGLAHVKDAAKDLIQISRNIRAALLDDTSEAVRKRIDLIGEFRSDFREALEEYRKGALLAQNIERAQRIRAEFDSLSSEQDKILGLAAAGKHQDAKNGLEAIRAAADTLDSHLAELEKTKLDRMVDSFADVKSVFGTARSLLLLLCLAAAAAAIVLGATVARIIGKPLVQSVEVLDAVAGGDFTQRLEIDSTDEVGRMAAALNRAVGEMRSALTDIRERSMAVAAAAEELASASEELSSGTQEQASSLEETSASLEEITATVRQNADNARQANDLAAGSRESAEKGGRIVGSTQSAMGEINASSKRIADIILTVDEIAFQTNLLALNAAVEAARAGEQGRGFAVVAGEVRSLAQRSAVAAKEIKALIQDSVRKVDTGAELVQRSGDTLEEIVASVKRVTGIVSEIAAASSEQATGITQVSQAMSQMDKVIQSNTAQTEELSATAQTLSEQASGMQERVSRFRLGDETGSVLRRKRRPNADGERSLAGAFVAGRE
jgi:methyl-accepting chemotaxis protein